MRIWSYTQPRYQKELNLTQQLPGKWPHSLRGPECWPLSLSPHRPLPFCFITPFLVPAALRHSHSQLPIVSPSCLLSPGDVASQCLGKVLWALEYIWVVLRGQGALPRAPHGLDCPHSFFAPNPTRGFSVISPQTAGVLKSGTAFRAAGVGARASRAGRRVGVGLECEGPLE